MDSKKCNWSPKRRERENRAEEYLKIECCSFAQLCLTLCHPTDCSTPGFPVLHHLLEFAQAHVH